MLAKPVIAGCLGWGTVNTSLKFLSAILLLVVYLIITKADRIETIATGMTKEIELESGAASVSIAGRSAPFQGGPFSPQLTDSRMTHIMLKAVLLSATIGIAGTGVAVTGVARANWESNLLQLEQVLKVPSLTPAAKAALDDAKTKALPAMRKDDDKTCHSAIVDGKRV